MTTRGFGITAGSDELINDDVVYHLGLGSCKNWKMPIDLCRSDQSNNPANNPKSVALLVVVLEDQTELLLDRHHLRFFLWLT